MDYIFLYNYNFQHSMNMHKKQSYYQQIELTFQHLTWYIDLFFM